ncbi:hypothetical protein FSARC_7449 [Fusarium sarcochroum]|uniref:Uncharacterized protein n=1 Tax=Fusarium sarcochroum TaxID=1208366 RepID=A0A8H4X7D5_9HYPO|nr:hypothetical protein FSARC_7449 [Fusarium sarcochroum]
MRNSMPLFEKTAEASSLRNVKPVLFKRLEIAAGEDTKVGSVLKRAIESAPLFKEKPFGIFKTFDKGLLGSYVTTTHLVVTAPGDEGYLAVNIASFTAEQVPSFATICADLNDLSCRIPAKDWQSLSTYEQRCVILAAIPQPLVQRLGLNVRERLRHFVEQSLDKILGMNLSPKVIHDYNGSSARQAYPSHQDPTFIKVQHVPTTYQPFQKSETSTASVAQVQGKYGLGEHGLGGHRERNGMIDASSSVQRYAPEGPATYNETNKTSPLSDDTTERIRSSEVLGWSRLTDPRPMHEQLIHEMRISTLNDFDYGLQSDIHAPRMVLESVWDTTWAQDSTRQEQPVQFSPGPLSILPLRQPLTPSSHPPPQSPYFYLPPRLANPPPSTTYSPTRTLPHRVIEGPSPFLFY